MIIHTNVPPKKIISKPEIKQEETNKDEEVIVKPVKKIKKKKFVSEYEERTDEEKSDINDLDSDWFNDTVSIND